MSRFEANMFEGYWYLEIEGEKMLKANGEKNKGEDKNEKNANDEIMHGNRLKGKFLLNIKIDANDYLLAAKAPDKKLTIRDKGLLSYFIRLVKDNMDDEEEEEL